ncbi:MAG: hypothetical protein Sw1PiTSA_07030 [Shewanella algae]|uniref:polymorphic toxin-type HINT domain-containing protein n=2 Tax=Shewanella algae TaxID=38313 RepID=UPI0011872FD4|nr:polymorphic toxin-type HINT domain-containing protein [Shewanella algae]MBO2579493.1 hypothetical protein [Shewanella algae]MBO2697831.1 hypothetical protein [Shewanella algae]QTE94338.1 hypothetical protein JKK45_18195 [Shewanella algae]TVK91370.1 hypothetical protein AYJ01_19430 [Shewanella algae]BCV26828.1 hypothetical protein TUM3811_06880 [Shewanella algae]
MKFFHKNLFLLIALLFSNPALSETVRYQHTDMLGSVVAESDSAGNIISRSHYEPFGKRLGGDKAGIGYTGHLQDEDLNLTYMQARYYDPLIGRFYSNDPVDYTAKNPVMSFNRYLYVNNNPYKYTDPNGEFLDTIIDFALIAYDLGDMAVNGVNETNSASLAANVAGALIPGATGLGLAARAGKAGKRSCCFVAGTQVLTEDGYKNIEDVKLGEKLWAKNTDTGEQEWKPVTKIFVEPDRGIFEVNLVDSDGFEQKIQATDDHPFYVVGRGWKQTIELKEGDLIETDGYGSMKVANVRDELRTDLTYNFTVADFHTYYVTKKNVLVHNCGDSVTTSVVQRKSAGGDGGQSQHIIEKVDGQTTSTTHKVTVDGKTVHQHQEHVGKHGSVKRFSDELTGTETINAPKSKDRPVTFKKNET